MGLTLQGFRDLIATDLKVTVGTELSVAELNRCVGRIVDDLSRYMPLEKVHEETLDFDVTDESLTTPATASATAIVNAQTLYGETAGATIGIADLTPDVPRRLTVTLNDANYSISELTLIVKGYDQDGHYIEESWYLSDLKVSGVAYQGKLYFCRITQVELDNIANASAADTISVGTGNAYDSFIYLANKPIKPESETVTSSPAGTTYTRDTDYTMDYANGAIKFITTGDMAAGTAYLIDYTKSRLGIDIGSLLPIVTRIQRVQYPADRIPQQSVSYNIIGDFMYIGSQKIGESQEQLTDKKHLVIYYERKHMPPGEGSPGSYPDVLDEVVAIGAAGYALLTEAQQYEQASGTAIGVMNDALTNVIKYLNNNSNVDVAGILQDITDNASELRTAIIDCLTNAHTYINEVDTVDLGQATVGAEGLLETGDDKIDAVNVGARVAENYSEFSRTRVNIATARTNAALVYVQEAVTRLSNLRTYLEQAGGYNALADGFFREAQMRAETVNGNLVLADRFRTEGLTRLNEFHRIMKNKAEYRKRTSSTPVQQPA